MGHLTQQAPNPSSGYYVHLLIQSVSFFITFDSVFNLVIIQKFALVVDALARRVS